MKIGKFASENNISVDTIRYYMDLGLLVPQKLGGHYDFDKRCKGDLENIIRFKDMGFTLNEIKNLFIFKKLGKLTPYEEDQHYKAFFTNKYKEVNDKIRDLVKTREFLKGKIDELSEVKYGDNFKMGIDINLLNFFICRNCKSNLILNEGNIENNKIIKGKLTCRCGKEYIIEDGIMILNKETLGKTGIDSSHTMVEYINETHPRYLENIYISLEWGHKNIEFNDLKDKVILDLGSGSGFFLRYVYEDLPEDAVYIAVDHDINRHRFLKDILQKSSIEKNIIFICCDFLDMPIKDKSIDVVIDSTGTTNYSFTNKEFLLRLTDNYIKENSTLLGSYLLFENFGINTKIGVKYRKNFILDNIKKEIKDLNYKIIRQKVGDPLDQGGKYEDYFKEGERVFSYSVYSKR
ncbi:MerR family transcriptional regulator [Dethiothermospora halolimnae]|uniref:MerR family transcriptional regulator n=1 Tax=Dethiothermospora halolimnae TaxID=3114390 RepID=UPI003CCBCD52